MRNANVVVEEMGGEASAVDGASGGAELANPDARQEGEVDTSTNTVSTGGATPSAVAA